MDRRLTVMSAFNRFEGGFGKDVRVVLFLSARFDHHHTLRAQGADCVQVGDSPQPLASAIGGIGKNEIGRIPAPVYQPGSIACDNLAVIHALQFVNIFSQNSQSCRGWAGTML